MKSIIISLRVTPKPFILNFYQRFRYVGNSRCSAYAIFSFPPGDNNNDRLYQELEGLCTVQLAYFHNNMRVSLLKDHV